MVVNKRKAAEILGKTEAALTAWRKEGMPVRKTRSRTGALADLYFSDCATGA